MYENDYVYSNTEEIKTICGIDDPVYFEFNVGVEGVYYLTVNQRSKRHY